MSEDVSRVPPVSCPSCGKLLDTASALHSHRDPRPGDACVCFDCTQVLVFGHDGVARLPTAAETTELERDPELAVVRGLIARFNMKRRRQ